MSTINNKPNLSTMPDLCLVAVFRRLPLRDQLATVPMVCRNWTRLHRVPLTTRSRLTLVLCDDSREYQNNIDNTDDFVTDTLFRQYNGIPRMVSSSNRLDLYPALRGLSHRSIRHSILLVKTLTRPLVAKLTTTLMPRIRTLGLQVYFSTTTTTGGNIISLHFADRLLQGWSPTLEVVSLQVASIEEEVVEEVVKGRPSLRGYRPLIVKTICTGLPRLRQFYHRLSDHVPLQCRVLETIATELMPRLEVVQLPDLSWFAFVSRAGQTTTTTTTKTPTKGTSSLYKPTIQYQFVRDTDQALPEALPEAIEARVNALILPYQLGPWDAESNASARQLVGRLHSLRSLDLIMPAIDGMDKPSLTGAFRQFEQCSVALLERLLTLRISLWDWVAEEEDTSNQDTQQRSIPAFPALRVLHLEVYKAEQIRGGDRLLAPFSSDHQLARCFPRLARLEVTITTLSRPQHYGNRSYDLCTAHLDDANITDIQPALTESLLHFARKNPQLQVVLFNRDRIV